MNSLTALRHEWLFWNAVVDERRPEQANRYHRLVEIDRAAFEELVADAMDEVPEPFAAALDEVAVVVEERAPAHMGALYGLYHGVPLTAGGPFTGQLPAHITIYMHPMIDHFAATGAIVEQVRITVLHELGHHLGLDEDDLDRLGYA